MNQYIDKLAKHADRYAQLSMKAYLLYVKILGTDCTITRHKSGVVTQSGKDADRYHKLLQSVMTPNEAIANHPTEVITRRLLINRSQMSNRFNKSTEDLQVTTPEDILRPGDVVSFDYLGRTYRFKVTNEIDSFGLEDSVLYRATLTPYRDTR